MIWKPVRDVQSSDFSKHKERTKLFEMIWDSGMETELEFDMDEKRGSANESCCDTSDSGMDEYESSPVSNASPRYRRESPTSSYESEYSKSNIPFRPQIITPSEGSAFSKIERLASSSPPSGQFSNSPFMGSQPFGYFPGMFPPSFAGNSNPLAYGLLQPVPMTSCSPTSSSGRESDGTKNMFTEVNTSIPFTNYFQNLMQLLKKSHEGPEEEDREPGEITKNMKPENPITCPENKQKEFPRLNEEPALNDDAIPAHSLPSQPVFPNRPMFSMNHLLGPTPFLPSALPQMPQLSPNAQMMQYFAGMQHPPAGLIHPALLQMAGIRGRRVNTEKPPPIKKYKCDVCGKAFSRSNTLVTHKRIHTGDKPFKCEVCGRAFRQPGNLTRHRLTHTTVKPYVCPSCNKAFNRASNLHTHMRTHTNFKPFTCPYCGKGFHQKIDMKIHCYTHTGERPHRCDICGKGFTLISTLNSHRRIHTEQAQPEQPVE